MILVTVGTWWPFDRLVQAADELAARIEERVIIQRGASSYVPRFAQYVDTVDENQMQVWLSDARVVVSHAGAGSILSALQAGKPLVLVPRTARLGEVADDHQFELAEAMARRGRAAMVTNVSAESLAETIEQAMRLPKERSDEPALRTALRAWLSEQARQPQPTWRLCWRKRK